MNRIAKVAVFLGAADGFRLEHLALPSVQDQDILVQVIACTLCGSDVHTILGRRTEPTPTVLGHEIIGRIVEIGANANRIDARGYELSVGDRITWSLVTSCGSCFFCTRDLPQKCLKQSKYGHSVVASGKDLIGGLSEYCWIRPGTTIVKLAEHLSDELACPANCATATTMSAMEAADVQAGMSVLIVGAGMLGLSAVAIAHEKGCRTLGCIDFQQNRLQIASELGAGVTSTPDCWSIPHPLEPHGWDVVIETSGTTNGVELALRAARIGGTCVLVGSVWPDAPLAFSPEQIVRRCLRIVGVHNYKPRHLVQAVEFLENKAPKTLAGLVARWFSLDEIGTAATCASRSKEYVRVGIRP